MYFFLMMSLAGEREKFELTANEKEELSGLDLNCEEHVSDSETDSGPEEEIIENKAFPQQRFSPVMKPSLPGDITHKPKAIKINPEVFASGRELTGSPTSQPLSTVSRSKESMILSPRPLNSGRKFQPTGAVFKAHTPKSSQEQLQLESNVRPPSAKSEGGFHSQKSPVMSPLVKSPSVATSKLSLSVLPVSSLAGPIKNIVLTPSGDRHGLNLCNIQVPIGKPDSQMLAATVEQKNQSALVGFELGRVQKPLVMAMVASKTPNNQDSPLMAAVSVRSSSLPIPIVSKPFVSFSQTTMSLLPSSTNTKSIVTAPSGLNNRKNISAILLPGGFSTAAPFTILNRDVTVSMTKSVVPATLPGGINFASACRPEVAASVANEAGLSQILSPYATRLVLKASTAPANMAGPALQPYQIVQAPLQLQMVQSQPAGTILGIGRSGLKPQTSTQIQYLIPSFPLSQDAIHGKVVPVLQTSPAATSAAIVVDLAGPSTAAAAKSSAASGRTNVSAGARPMLKLAIASPIQPSISVQPQASPISAFPFFAGSQLLMLNQPQLSTVVTLAGGQQFQLAGLSQLAHVAMAAGQQQQQQQQHAIHHQK